MWIFYYWWLVRVILLVAFGFLPQNFGRLARAPIIWLEGVSSETDNSYHFFWANHQQGVSKFFSWIQYDFSVNSCDWRILAGNEKRIGWYCLNRCERARATFVKLSQYLILVVTSKVFCTMHFGIRNMLISEDLIFFNCFLFTKIPFVEPFPHQIQTFRRWSV